MTGRNPAAEKRTRPADGEGDSSALNRFLARAAVVTAVLTAAGQLFGLLRDQTIAHLFGADADTDAFLVAWTVPELAATLLIEDAMALILIPAFSIALSRRAARPPGGATTLSDPVWDLVAATLPRLSLGLAGAGGVLVLGAPFLVRLLAPGLPDPDTAVDCMRLTSLSVVTFGLAGYCSAVLRAHRHFVAPAAIYVAYNAAIITVMLTGHTTWGVRSAAFGIAVGGLLMVGVQLPFVLRRMPPRGARRRTGVRVRAVALPGLGVLAPVVVFALGRQMQVLYERFLASSLPAGAISHLNYAQKVAQMPMVLSLMVCTVTFPVVARAMADGRTDDARRRVERDLGLVSLVVLVGAAYVVACAPQIVQFLFERGAFDSRDTADTASVMRVYSCGLLGHSLVGALVRPFFSGSRPTWYPAAVMGAGLAVTGVVGAVTVQQWGVHGIAAANAVGITVTAVLLLRRLGTHLIAVDSCRLAAGLCRLGLAAAAATVAGRAAAGFIGPPLLSAVAGGVTVLVVFSSVALLVRAPETAQLFTAVNRRLRHAR